MRLPNSELAGGVALCIDFPVQERAQIRKAFSWGQFEPLYSTDKIFFSLGDTNTLVRAALSLTHIEPNLQSGVSTDLFHSSRQALRN